VIYVYIEANLSFVSANQIKQLIEPQSLYPIVVKSFDPKNDGRCGVWTGDTEKELYAIEMQRALSDGALVYADSFITSDDHMREEVRAQLEVYRREVRVTPGTGKLKVIYTGKSHGRKDDVAIVMQMLLYWSRVTRESTEYMEAAESNGWRM
jgi:hypothetical protein